MSKLEERESRRKASIVGSMIEQPAERGRAGAEKADQFLGAAQLVRGYEYAAPGRTP